MIATLPTADPARVISAARSWLGTPYHDQASLRGVGCDCLGLARGVWREVIGPEPFPIPPYSRDWGESGPREVLAEGASISAREAAISANRASPDLVPAAVLAVWEPWPPTSSGDRDSWSAMRLLPKPST